MDSPEKILRGMSKRRLSLMDVDEDEEDIKAKKAKPNKFKQKLIVPTGTWLEKKKCENLLNEKFDLLKEKRIARSEAISEGDWLDGECLVKVTRKRGSFWNHMGHSLDKDTFLHPEEAMFLMEISCLHVNHHEVPVSIQQAFTLFLSKSKIKLRDYRVYAHLNRLGYKVIRHKFQCFSKSLELNTDIIMNNVQKDKQSKDCNGTGPADNNDQMRDNLNLNVITASELKNGCSFIEDKTGITNTQINNPETNRDIIFKETNSSTTTIDISSETTENVEFKNTFVETISPEKAVIIIDDSVNTDLVAEILEEALDISNTPSTSQDPVIDITSEEEDIVGVSTGVTITPTKQGKRKRKSFYNPFSNQHKIMKPNDDKQISSLFNLIPESVGKNEVTVTPPKSHLVPKNINLLKKEYKVILKRESESVVEKTTQQQNLQISRNKIKRRKNNRNRNPNSQQFHNRPQYHQQQRWNSLNHHNQFHQKVNYTLQHQPTQWNYQNQSLSQLYINIFKRMQELHSFLRTPPHQRNNVFYNSLPHIPYGPKPWQQNNLSALYNFYRQKKINLASQHKHSSNGEVINIDCDDSDDVPVGPNVQRRNDPITVSLDSSSDSDCMIEEPDYEVINLDSNIDNTNESGHKDPQPSTSGYRKPSSKYAEMKKLYSYWLPPENDFGLPTVSSKEDVFELSLTERVKLLRIFMKQDGKRYSKWSELKESFDKALKEVPSETSKNEESDQIELTSIKLGCLKPLSVMKDVPCNITDLEELSIVKESAIVENDEWSESRIVFNVYELSDVKFRKNEMTPSFRVFSLNMNEDLLSIPDDLLEDNVPVLQVKVGTSSFTYFNTQGVLTMLEDYEDESEDSDQ